MTYELIRSKRKTIALTVTKDLRVVVRAPLKLSQKYINAFVDGHEKWIERQLALTQKRLSAPQNRTFSPHEVALLKARAKKELPKKAARFAALMGVSPAGVNVTSAKTRWGSCSAKNKLCFAFRVMLLPEDLIDLIVVHELAHIRAKNHGPAFYAEMARVLPDYIERTQKLKNCERGIELGHHAEA